MSTGGVFSIIVNDGKADRMIMATKLLNQRIRNIMCARRDAGKSDTTPTLTDLERTHIIFMNAHFKPHAAVGHEYNKVRPQSGSSTLGGSVTYSIPQFGDFFNDMVHHVTVGAAQGSAQRSPAAATGTPGVGVPATAAAMTSSTFPAAGADWDGSALTGATYSLVDPFGNDVAPDTDGAYHNMVKYCEYPGERLHQNTKFDVNGNHLDQYSWCAQAFLRKFCLSKDKTAGYNRMVGQENPIYGKGGPQLARAQDSHYNASAVFPNTAVDGTTNDVLPNQNDANPQTSNFSHQLANFGDAAWQRPTDTALSQTSTRAEGMQNVVRSHQAIVDGPQTPKYQQPACEMWNKLRFWFNDDTGLSIPSVSIPFGQRFITIDMATQDQLLHEHPGLYVRQSVDTSAAGQTANHGTTALVADDLGGIAGNGNLGNSRKVSYRPWVSKGSITDSGGSSSVALSGNPELYVNNIFVNPEIHDIFIKRIGFSLIRVWREHTARSNSGDDEKLLSQLKWPIEYMFVGLQPTHNTSSDNVNSHKDWHRMGKQYTYDISKSSHAEINMSGDGTDADAGVVSHRSRIDDQHPVQYSKSTSTMDSMSLTAHGVNITDDFPKSFHSSYTPFNYGGQNINTPDDEDAMMMNFALYPNSYQPSSHINVSRAREFYLKWKGKYSGAGSESTLYACARAINFLLVTDGSALLRYST